MSHEQKLRCAGCGKAIPEDELSPTTEDYASELLREAAPATVYIESVS